MDIEIIIRNATLEETRALFAVAPEGSTIRSQGNLLTLRGIAWTKEEIDSIRDCPDRSEALKAYREAFPGSPRSKHAVFRKFQYIIDSRKDPDPIPESRQAVPATIIETPENKKADMRQGPKYRSKYNIPFSSKTEKEQYNAAYKLCKKHNLPYPEVVRKIEASGKPESEPATVTQPVSSAVTPPYVPPVTMNQVDKSESVVGWRVKQFRADRGKLLPGTLTVMARRNGLIECSYEGKRHVIDAACLEVISK